MVRIPLRGHRLTRALALLLPILATGCLQDAFVSNERLFEGKRTTVIRDAILVSDPSVSSPDLDIGSIAIRRIPGTDFYEMVTTKQGSLYNRPSVVEFVRASDLAPTLPGDGFVMIQHSYAVEGDDVVRRYSYWPFLFENRRELVLFPFAPEVYEQLLNVAACPFLRTTRTSDKQLAFAIAEPRVRSALAEEFGAGPLLGASSADKGFADVDAILDTINYRGPTVPHPGPTATLQSVLANCQETAEAYNRSRWSSSMGRGVIRGPQEIENAITDLLRVIGHFRDRGRNIYAMLTDEEIATGLPMRFVMRRHTYDQPLTGIDTASCQNTISARVPHSQGLSREEFLQKALKPIGNILVYLEILCPNLHTINLVPEEGNSQQVVSLRRQTRGWQVVWRTAAPTQRPASPPTTPGSPSRPGPGGSVDGGTPQPANIASAIQSWTNGGEFLSSNQLLRIISSGYVYQCGGFDSRYNSCDAAVQFRDFSNPAKGRARLERQAKKQYKLVLTYSFFTYKGFVCFAPRRATLSFSPRLPAKIRAAKHDLARSRVNNTDGDACIGFRRKADGLEQVRISSKNGKLKVQSEAATFMKGRPRLR